LTKILQFPLTAFLLKMAELAYQGEENTSEEKITTTVKFLREVHEKGFKNETTLRSYLLSKHGLTQYEVDEAYRIHRERFGDDILNQDRQDEDERDEQIQFSNDADRPERTVEGPNKKDKYSMSFLLEEKKGPGGKLFLDFLENELNYCRVLECLCNEYSPALRQMANEGKFAMTQEEVDEIFNRVPDLLDFHKKNFYSNLIKGTDISKTFLRYFKTFGDYVEYMKECTATIKTMRQYTGDKKLHKVLEQIKRKSTRPNDDMIDLLLVPLDRMSDYKEFLSTIHMWADRTQTVSYELISKATRRFGRLVGYIEKYKLGIFNRSEMNKVQQFLSNQCNIFVPNRRIVRRGVMIRRTTGWAARNKQYIFFLFNDVLLWTTKSGELQNVVMLRECEVMETESKYYPKRKLKVVSVGHKNKILHLECATERQRDEWFDAIEKSISKEKAAMLVKDGDNEDEAKTAGFDEVPDIAPLLVTKETERSGPGIKPNGGIRLGDYDDQPGTPPSEDNYHHRMEYSINFPNAEFKDFEPLDDTVSVSEMSNYDDFKSAAELSLSNLGAFQNADSSEKRKNFKIQRTARSEKPATESTRLLKITEGEKEIDEGEDDASDVSSHSKVKSNEPINSTHQPKSSIIRHTAPPAKERKPFAATKLSNIPNTTIRLNDFDFR